LKMWGNGIFLIWFINVPNIAISSIKLMNYYITFRAKNVLWNKKLSKISSRTLQILNNLIKKNFWESNNIVDENCNETKLPEVDIHERFSFLSQKYHEHFSEGNG
jgi:hypothetical protein